MVRWIGVVLLMGCLAAKMVAQASKEEGSAAAQVSGAEPAQPDQSSTPAAKSENPLDAFTDFSAIMVGTSMPMGDSTDAYIYRSGNLMRMEGPEGHGYFVTDLTTRETYGVSPGPCMHDMTHAFVRASPFITGKPGPKKVERVAAGKETLDGHSCQIEDVTITPQNSSETPFRMRLWEADDLKGFPIRIDVKRGTRTVTIRYKNVVLGPQDPTLFIHPKSCQSPDVEHAVTQAPRLNTAPKKPATSPPPQ